MYRRETGKKLSPKEIRKKQEQKRIDEIEKKSKDVKVGPSKKSEPKLTEKEIKNKKRVRKFQERKEREKKTPFVDFIIDVIKTPYHIRGGEIESGNDTVIYKSKGGLIKGKPKLATKGWK